MPPTWLTGLSWVSLVAAFASAALISYDLFVRGYRQRMG
ncbi:MAG: rane protein, partial [Mycobacterium sp.]|nr:rane protein [Mycobacterium sp.]